ncbi:RNA polymerase sigma-70 factor (sigma-E family) [Thermocatellispora tengchongensis]|uniref:RNA polymerase sigma-70 factor (Sigma-E family) n=1 Tax=Thermocatellispora tengchongensis TaxID=1073253 RepID=A0A840PJX0_9ACTN|nr:SigE family RNA polymerase sigma factor [Thermocatellispora tengchongensis]MBB5139206.1 RNA polymerase sigma-70 factor (sigma-E family) [Thermocatellispora tengchongensis]
MDRYQGFREFVGARQQSLMRSAYLLTGDAHLAEDLLQNVLVKVARHWPKLAGGGDPEAYTRRALINEHISWRRRRRSAEYPQEHPPEPGHDSGDDTLHRVALQRALARLTPRQRAVIVLRFYEDRSVEETAQLLGCSPGTVKSQTSHALGRLRVLAPDLAHLLHDTAAPGDAPAAATPGAPAARAASRAASDAEENDR